MIWYVSLSLQAGPIGYFCTEKGALIRGEVLYADDAFYYYQRVSNPEEILTIKIENVPASFRRIVDALRLKGEISAPPESIAVVQKVFEKPYGDWQIKEFEQGNLSWHIATLITEDVQGRAVFLKTRYCEATDYDYRKFDVFLFFSDAVTQALQWQVTYQFDNEEPVTELWKGVARDITALRGSSSTAFIDPALFSPTSFWFSGKLMESDYVNFSINDDEGETRCFRFATSHFDRVYEDVFKPLMDK